MNTSTQIYPPRNLRCELLENPIGIETRKPCFSWQFVARSQKIGAHQTAFQVRIAKSVKDLRRENNLCWDSGRIDSEQNLHIEYNGEELKSRDCLWWTVRVWDNAGQSTSWSKPARFEMGLLESSDWEAEWICADEKETSPLFRHEFTVDKQPVSARAYICGLGYYELTVNGQRIGDHVLDPNWTNYDCRDTKDLLYPFDDQSRKRALYVVYDVTAALNLKGKSESESASNRHAVGVWLGNGMHNQRERTVEGKMWYGAPRLLFQLEMTFADGSRSSVFSNQSWRWSPSPIVFNNVFYGEVYDAGLEQPNWNLPGFDDSHWNNARPAPKPTGELHSQLSSSDKIIGEIKAKKMWQVNHDTWGYDFGRNFSGWVRIQLPPRTKNYEEKTIQLRFAEEKHEDGRLDFTSSGGESQIQCDRYIMGETAPDIAHAEAKTYEPRFVWHCFRFAELSGFPGTPSLDTITGVEVHADVSRCGTFRCSNRTLTWINETFVRTQLANMHGGVPSDCPHRERLGYTGDGQLTAEAALWNLDAASFYSKWCDDIHDAQNRKTGFVPHTAPFYGGGGGPAWGSAIVIVPWQHYRFYGDERILSSHYDAMRLWLDYLERCTDSHGIVVHEEPGSWCLGDWSLPLKINKPDDIPVSPALVNTAYYGFCSKLMAEIAGVLGKDTESSEFIARLSTIRTAFHKAFFDAEHNCYGNGVHGANAIAIALGAVPDQLQQTIINQLVKGVIDNGFHFDTGIVGTPILLDVLSENGRVDLAYKIMTGTSFPSFGYMRTHGASALWENWYEECGSHCHPMYGSVCAWLYRYIAGLRLDSKVPAFRKFKIVPPNIPNLNLTAVKIATSHGLLELSWKKRLHQLDINLRIPSGCIAEMDLSAYRVSDISASSKKLSGGTHRLMFDLVSANVSDTCVK